MINAINSAQPMLRMSLQPQKQMRKDENSNVSFTAAVPWKKVGVFGSGAVIFALAEAFKSKLPENIAAIGILLGIGLFVGGIAAMFPRHAKKKT